MLAAWWQDFIVRLAKKQRIQRFFSTTRFSQMVTADAAPLSPAAPDTTPLSAGDTARLARVVMRRQAALSLRVASVFLLIILGLPLVNWLAPQVAGVSVGGFTLSWLFLGVLFYPVTWLLSGYFIRRSDQIEDEMTQAGRASLIAGNKR